MYNVEDDNSSQSRSGDQSVGQTVVIETEKKQQYYRDIEDKKNELQHEQIIGDSHDDKKEVRRLEPLASPSFRIYCVEPLVKLEDDQLNHKEQANVTATASSLHPGNTSHVTRRIEPPKYRKRKETRKMKFAAVLNLLKTKGGCYYPSCKFTCGYVPKEPF